MSYSLHHFVPQFYLRRFAGQDDLVWVYDKQTDRTFASTPRNLAAERGLYTLPGSIVDPSYLEKSFADVEAQAALITDSWMSQLPAGDVVTIPEAHREVMSLYFTLQLLRTTEARTVLLQNTKESVEVPMGGEELQLLHLSVLWDEGLVDEISTTIYRFIWMFAKNVSSRSLWTSDDPIRVRSHRTRTCLNWARIGDEGAYLAIPLTPRLILFCYDRRLFRKDMQHSDGRVSPVVLTEQLVKSENMPQIGHARRYVFADQPDFSDAKGFCDLHPQVRSQDRERFARQTQVDRN